MYKEYDILKISGNEFMELKLILQNFFTERS